MQKKQKGRYLMPENKLLHELYQNLKGLDEEAYLQLISETEDKDEIEFYVKVMDIILQQRQRAALLSNNK